MTDVASVPDNGHADASEIFANRIAHAIDATDGQEATDASEYPASAPESQAKPKSKRKAKPVAVVTIMPSALPAVSWESECQAIDLAVSQGTSLGDLAERFAKSESTQGALSSLRYGRLCYLATVRALEGTDGMGPAQIESRVNDKIYADVVARIVPYVDFRSDMAVDKKVKALQSRVGEWLRTIGLVNAIPSAAFLGSAALRACAGSSYMRSEGHFYAVAPDWLSFLSAYIPSCVESQAKGDEVIAGLTDETAKRQKTIDLATLATRKQELEHKRALASTDAERQALTDELKRVDAKQQTLTDDSKPVAVPSVATGGKPVKLSEKQVKYLLSRVAQEPDLAKSLGTYVWSTTAAYALVAAMGFDVRNTDALASMAKAMGKSLNAAA
jgi:hypothetical protein